MKLIVGLGNPGKNYEATRHNFGFLVVEALALSLSATFRSSSYRGELAEIRHAKHDKVFLLKPQTFMNLSGQSVQPLATFYKIPPENILAVHDDLDMPLGRIRLALRGSAGGHNGIKSLIDCFGTQEFPRLKLGIGRPLHPEHAVVDYVLQRFAKDERSGVEKTVSLAVKALLSYLDNGLERAMNEYNGKSAT